MGPPASDLHHSKALDQLILMTQTNFVGDKGKIADEAEIRKQLFLRAEFQK